MRQAQGNPQVRNARTSASKKFGRYKTEEEKATRKADMKEDETLKQLKSVWHSHHLSGKQQDDYQRAKKILQGIDYSAEDVERFSLVLSEFQDEENFPYKAGLFLDALVMGGKDDDYHLRLEHIGKEIWCLGTEIFKKNIFVEGGFHVELGYVMSGGRIYLKGNGGSSVGIWMKAGEIIVDGDCGKMAGEYLAGGLIMINGNAGDRLGMNMKKKYTDLESKIVVKGNAGHEVGKNMEGGVIIIEGNAGEEVGNLMKGGEIHIGGDFKSLGEIEVGKIYHKGKLIVDKKPEPG